jgi:hypothetical protein
MIRKAFKQPKVFRKVNTVYRAVLIDEESLEEVASYRLTLGRLYTVISMIFVLVVVVTVSIMLLTPMKYYIPGYGSDVQRLQVIKLKRNVDSLADMVAAQHQYEDNLRKVIAGEIGQERDTAMLNLKLVKDEAMKTMLPKAEEIKKDAIESIKQDNRKKKKLERAGK